MKTHWALLALIAVAASCYMFTLFHFHTPAKNTEVTQALIRHQAAKIAVLQEKLDKAENRAVVERDDKDAKDEKAQLAGAFARSQEDQIAALKAQLAELQRVDAEKTDNRRAEAAAASPGESTLEHHTMEAADISPGETFLLVTRTEMHEDDGARSEARRVLRSLLGLASLLNRTLILPATTSSPGAVHDGTRALDGRMTSPITSRTAVAELRRLGLRTRPAGFLSASLPEELRCSHVRLQTPRGLDSEQLAHALRHYTTTRILEIDNPQQSYCGPSPRASSSLLRTEAALDTLIAGEGVVAANALLGQCLHSLREEEVDQYWDMGKCKAHRVHVALPMEILKLPKGSDLLVTFSTGGVATMAQNWVLALRKAGVAEGVVIGALDDAMVAACKERGLPCVPVQGDAKTVAELGKCKEKNVRKCPDQYPMMSTLKVGFYRELLSQGFNVFACDSDAIFMNDPRALMHQEPWIHADLAVATDCIDVPGDAQHPLLHCDFNTGMVFLRGNEAVLNFTEAWREKVANAKEKRIRDQAAFNMITKASPGLSQYRDASGKDVPRVYLAARGGESNPLRLGVLPLDRFLNGHTFFVQHVHTLPAAAPAVSVHMTYQFAEGSSFAYGKRQRLREAGLWFVDGDDYYSGQYVAVSERGANLPPITIATDADSRVAVKQHLAEHAHRVAVLRALLGIGKALGRKVVLPRMLCYCDYMWKEMKSCRVGGAESMRLPFDCPMDHVLDTPLFFENTLGVEVREPGFLSHVRRPLNATIAKVSLPHGSPLTDAALRELLAPHAAASVLEIDQVAGRFCGFTDQAQHAVFTAESERILRYDRVPFCTMEGSDNAPLYSRCCEPWHPGEKFFPCVYGFGKPAPLPACMA